MIKKAEPILKGTFCHLLRYSTLNSVLSLMILVASIGDEDSEFRTEESRRTPFTSISILI
jgi:hypothetical protein